MHALRQEHSCPKRITISKASNEEGQAFLYHPASCHALATQQQTTTAWRACTFRDNVIPGFFSTCCEPPSVPSYTEGVMQQFLQYASSATSHQPNPVVPLVLFPPAQQHLSLWPQPMLPCCAVQTPSWMLAAPAQPIFQPFIYFSPFLPQQSHESQPSTTTMMTTLVPAPILQVCPSMIPALPSPSNLSGMTSNTLQSCETTGSVS